jgi:hypothetical protein
MWPGVAMLEELCSLHLEHTNRVIMQNDTQHHLDKCATKVQHLPSATISVKPSTHTLQFDAFNRSCVVQRSKALHLSARGVTTDPGSILGCITTGRDRESHSAAHFWLSVVRVRGEFGRGRPSL